MKELSRPFLKWAGGKYRVLPHILKVLPKGKRFIEPFIGSGAVFLNTDYAEYLLADNNADLISLYQYLQNEGDDFIEFSQQLFSGVHNNREEYYQLRNLFNETDDLRLKSALFIYLNRHGYNGLCRYNPKGQFNVPFGRYTNPKLSHLKLQKFYFKMQNAVLMHADFTDILNQARRGDVVYCDPPYVPLSKTAKFTSYSTPYFGEAEQRELASRAGHLAKKGITVIVSNHDTEFTRKLYQSAKIISFSVPRYISCKSENRQQAQELLAVF